MTISSVSSDSNVRRGYCRNQSHQVRIDVKVLRRSLATGNLSGAQTAFSTLVQDAQPLTRRGELAYYGFHGNDHAKEITPDAFADFAALNNALQANDLTGAQKAFGSMMQDLGAKSHNLAGAPKAFESMMEQLQRANTTPNGGTGSIVNTTA